MKKNLLTLFVLFSFSTNYFSQCTTAILPSPAYTQITSSQAIDAEAGLYWVCAGLTIDINSSPGSAFYLENDVTINVNNIDGIAVTAKPGCVINNNSDESVIVVGNASTLTLNNNAGGTLLVGIECPEVIYTYDLVDEASCIDISTVDENSSPEIAVFPNPVAKGEVLHIALSSTANLTVYNSLGQNIKQISNFTGELSTAEFTSGNYILSIEMANQIFKRRLRVL